ncbi:TPA: hypothetical protein ACOEHG_000878 [Enterobacter ludwigii]
MTPRQRRQHTAALEKAASAPRKSWLGKYHPLTSIQSAWAKSLLSVWGECYGGRTSEQARLNGGGFWTDLQGDEWSDEAAKRITDTIKGLRKIGYRGEDLLKMAKGILWPKPTLVDAINDQMKRDDGDFVEKCILAALKSDDPVYVVGVNYYAGRKRISDIGRYLQSVAPWLSRQQAEDRARWCVSHFNSAVFLSMRAALKQGVENKT